MTYDCAGSPGTASPQASTMPSAAARTGARRRCARSMPEWALCAKVGSPDSVVTTGFTTGQVKTGPGSEIKGGATAGTEAGAGAATRPAAAAPPAATGAVDVVDVVDVAG